LQEIAAGGGFPVEHLAGEEDAGPGAQHEVRVEGGERNAAGGGDGARDGCCRCEADRDGFDQDGGFLQRQRGEAARSSCFVEEADGGGSEL
jgi:hypothetical protein